MSRTTKDKNVKHIDPDDIPVRDYLMVDIINGVTKSGAHRDKVREADKYRCRTRGKRYHGDED